MQFSKTLIDGALQMVGRFHPDLAPLLSLVIQYEPQIESLGPILQAAAKEGPGAFAAAEQHAPELAQAIRNFVHTLPASAATPVDATKQMQVQAENVTREIIGWAPMNPDEEKSWMEKCTDGLNDSRTGSA